MIPALERHRRESLWSSLVSQSDLSGEFQFKERSFSKEVDNVPGGPLGGTPASPYMP